MKNYLILFLLVVATASTAFGVPTFVPGVTATSSPLGYLGQTPDVVVDGVGMLLDDIPVPGDPNAPYVSTWVHIADSSGYGEWLSTNMTVGVIDASGDPMMLTPDGSAWVPFEQYLEFDLAFSYTVGEMHIWNAGQTAAGTQDRGFRKVDIKVSSDGGATYTMFAEGVVLNSAHDLYGPLAQSDRFPATDILDMGDIEIDHVRIYAYPDYLGGDFSGVTDSNPWAHVNYFYMMSEIRFAIADTGPQVYIPEEDALTRNQVTATASSDWGGAEPQLPWVTDHVGIRDPQAFTHSNNGGGWGMWMSAAGGGGYLNPAASGLPASRTLGRAWVKFEFDEAHDLGFMSVWNHNQENLLIRGMRNVYIDYTADGGTTWNPLGGDPDAYYTLRPGTGLDGMIPGDDIDFGGVTADTVVITALDVDGNYGSAQFYGLSEVRFGLYGDVWADPDYPSQDVLTHDKITVSIPLTVDSQDGEVARLVDNVGLGDNFRHVAEQNGGDGMLLCDPNDPSAAVPGQTVTGATWYRFDFDQVYNLGKMHVWNHNQINHLDYTDRGLKNVTVEYTSDGVNWNTLGTDQIAQALAETQSTFDPNEIDFAGAAASSVVITASDNWGDPDLYGLSQVQFGLDGTVFGYDISHLSAFVSQWLDDGIVGEDCLLPPGWDLNGDCYVNFYDFAVVAERWLLNN